MKKPTETQLVHACLKLLALHRVVAFRNNTGARTDTHKGKRRFTRFGIPGSPDIIGVLPGGRFLGVEVKLPGGTATAAQDAFLRVVNATGGLGCVVRSIADLEAFLKNEGVIR